jgi:hypothetical protein
LPRVKSKPRDLGSDRGYRVARNTLRQWARDAMD